MTVSTTAEKKTEWLFSISRLLLKKNSSTVAQRVESQVKASTEETGQGRVPVGVSVWVWRTKVGYETQEVNKTYKVREKKEASKG